MSINTQIIYTEETVFTFFILDPINYDNRKISPIGNTLLEYIYSLPKNSILVLSDDICFNGFHSFYWFPFAFELVDAGFLHFSISTLN